jgi:hypothetical protein
LDLVQRILVERLSGRRSKLPGVNGTAIIIYGEFAVQQWARR